MRSDRRLVLPLLAAAAAVLCCVPPGLIAFVADATKRMRVRQNALSMESFNSPRA
jgi:ferredoxin-NADP reductase